MKVGDRVTVVKTDGGMMSSWVKTGMEGEIIRIYPAGAYRYHVEFSPDEKEDFSSEEICVKA